MREKSTRSERTYGTNTLFLLKSRQNPKNNRYITETEKNNLIRKGLLKNE